MRARKSVSLGAILEVAYTRTDHLDPAGDYFDWSEIQSLWGPSYISLEKTLMLEKAEGKRRSGQQRIRLWEAPTQRTWVWANSGDSERQGSLACHSPWGLRVGYDWATEQPPPSSSPLLPVEYTLWKSPSWNPEIFNMATVLWWVLNYKFASYSPVKQLNILLVFSALQPSL